MSFRYCLILLILIGGVFNPLWGNDAEAEKVHSVLRKLASFETFSADFKQTRYISFMKKAISQNGRIFIDSRNHRFAVYISNPIRFICIADEKKLMQWDEETRKTVILDLKKHPMLSRLFYSISFFQRNSAILTNADFKLQLKGRNIIVDVSSNSSFYEFMRCLELILEKDDRYIEKIIFRDSSGDRTEMEFENVHLNHVISSETWSIPR